MNTCQQLTNRHIVWFTLGMMLLTWGILAAALQHSHRVLLWVGMGMMLVGGLIAAVTVLRPRHTTAHATAREN